MMRSPGAGRAKNNKNKCGGATASALYVSDAMLRSGASCDSQSAQAAGKSDGARCYMISSGALPSFVAVGAKLSSNEQMRCKVCGRSALLKHSDAAAF